MSHKFAIVIEIKNGKPEATAYIKAEANKASEHFIRLREEQKEAYYFQHPIADRRSKSAEQIKATLGDRDENGAVKQPAQEAQSHIPEHKKSDMPHPVPVKKSQRNKIQGVSLDIDASEAVDM